MRRPRTPSLRSRQRSPVQPAERDPLAAHLARLDAGELREMLMELASRADRGMRAWLEDEAARRVMRVAGYAVLETMPDPQLATDVATICRSLERSGRGDPAELDEVLARIGQAWLAGDHMLVRSTVAAISRVLSEGVDFGQDELYDEVLTADLYELRARVLVSVYLTSEPGERARAIREAMRILQPVASSVWEPLAELAKTALDPLPDFESFVHEWARSLRTIPPPSDGHLLRAWEREAAQWIDGPDGLAALARQSGRADDFEAWMRVLLAERRLSAAADVAREGAALLDAPWQRARLWSWAARIDLEQGLDPRPALESAFTSSPSGVHARRWLAHVADQELTRSARSALAAHRDLPDDAAAVLAVVAGDWERVAKLTPQSDVAFDAVVWVLRGPIDPAAAHVDALDADELGARLEDDIATDSGVAHLVAPSAIALATRARAAGPDQGAQALLITALQEAAMSRFVAVARTAHRSRYDGAARTIALAAAILLACDQSGRARELVRAAHDEAGRKWRLREATDRELLQLAPAVSVDGASRR